MSIIVVLFNYGYTRLNQPSVERETPIKVRLIQPNITQSEKWKPELANRFLNKQVEMSKSAKTNKVDLIVWPETAISYAVQSEKTVRDFILSKLLIEFFDSFNKCKINQRP